MKVLKHLIRKRGIMVSHDNMRELGNVAKETGILIEELRTLAKTLFQEHLDSCFASKMEES